MTLDTIRKTIMTNHIQSVIKALYSAGTELRRVSMINGHDELFGNDKSKKAPVLTVHLPKPKLDHKVKVININSFNLLYDLYTLHDYPKLTTVRFNKFSQLMLPFATTDDAKLVFPQVTTIDVGANHESCIADEIPMSKLFPSADTFVLRFREQSKDMYRKNNYQCLQACKCKIVAVINEFYKEVQSEFMQVIAEMLATNDDVKCLVVVNMGSKAVVVNMATTVFKHRVHVSFVNLDYVNKSKCNASAVDILRR